MLASLLEFVSASDSLCDTKKGGDWGGRQNSSSGAETTVWGSRDDPGVVGERKKNSEGFYKVLFESQVRRRTVFYRLRQKIG